MIIQEMMLPEEEGGWVLIKTYSNTGYMIRQDETGDLYEEAIDPQFAGRTYTETDIKIEEYNEPNEDENPSEQEEEPLEQDENP